MSLVERIVSACCRAPALVACTLVALGVASGTYTAANFNMDTDSTKLISPKVDWRQREIHFDSLFPQQVNLILVVVDGATPELAEAGTVALSDALAKQAKLFSVVRRPDGGDFFNKNGLLFLPLAEVRANTQQMIAAAPFLGPMAGDPSLRGIMTSLSTALQGVRHGQAKLSDLQRPLAGLGGALETVAAGGKTFFSWRALVSGAPAPGRETRRFIEVQPRLDFGALEPGAGASDAIRAAAAALHLTPADGVRVRLTGPVPLSDEEFATLADRAALMGAAMMLAVLATLWLAVRSFRIILCILVTLFVGLAITMALGLYVAHVFNIISIAFVALFVGLGVDFGIQFCVRYRHERFVVHDLKKALVCAGRSVGTPLALAAAATAAGFFSFLPTSYVGVAELGLVAGIGMIVAFATSITLLPALLMLIKPIGEDDEVGYRFFAGVDRIMVSHRRQVMGAAIAVAAVAAVLTTFVKFDFNPLDLRSAKTESVSTIQDLMRDPQTSPNTIDVLASNLDAARALARRLAAMPVVGQAITLADFVPDDQTRKLALIDDANSLLDATLNPFTVKPPPSDAELAESLGATARALRQAADATPAGRDATRLADALDRLAAGNADLRARATAALVPGLKTLLGQMSASLEASRVDLAAMPQDLMRDWVAKDGTARIQVSPSDTSGTNQSLNVFSKAVLKIVPDATGAPISIRESGTTIVVAFEQAGALSFVVITVLLLLVLRKARDVMLTIIPLLLTGLLTMATAVAIGLQLNFANVIALPLLFGIGVAFNIYFVMAWRAGQVNLLQSSLTRAVIFSAATTASGFGSLWLSSHPGTASMGELLMISLAWTLATTLFFLPALMGPPPK
ncbi:MAG TPA: MMPL family transporter [Rhizomicrobium sp.]|jgi:hopanoid biosynthesis associated RND transporter like protein HpnN|nr:MMPL family transporter [Rhizomicrobium sp.]